MNNSEFLGISLEVPEEITHVTYWDDVQEVCEVAKQLFTRHAPIMNFSSGESVTHFSERCLNISKVFVEAQRAYKTLKADEFRAAETECSKKI